MWNVHDNMMKKYIREILVRLPVKWSKNLEYDRLTRKVIYRVCRDKSNCIDVGCHKGEVLDILLKAAPGGHHIAFEPIPEMAEKLRKKYSNKPVTVYDYALSNRRGTSSFNHVVSNPAYSGLKKRRYDREEEDEQIVIKVALLDDFAEASQPIDLVKIDVEGGELDVLKGGKMLLKRDRPVLIFEHGKGSAEHYGSGPEKMYVFLTELGYRIYSLKDYLGQKPSFSLKEFVEHFKNGTEYYFVARMQSGQ